MAKSKLERIANVEKEIKELEVQKKQLLQQHKEQEHKARTNRLCKRGGYVEKHLPDLITLNDEQFESFIEKTLLTPHSRSKLAECHSSLIFTSHAISEGLFVITLYNSH